MTNVDFREADAFELLSGYASARRTFDTIVLDPPAFAKSRKQMDGAVRGYKDINLRALRLLRPGGILVTCSCSHHMSEAMLLESAGGSFARCRAELRVLERRTQSQDHPILLTVPETHYLKCVHSCRIASSVTGFGNVGFGTSVRYVGILDRGTSLWLLWRGVRRASSSDTPDTRPSASGRAGIP